MRVKFFDAGWHFGLVGNLEALAVDVEIFDSFFFGGTHVMKECAEAIVFSHGLNEIVKILGAHVDFVSEIIDEVAGSIGGSGKELASTNFIRVTIDKIAVAVI